MKKLETFKEIFGSRRIIFTNHAFGRMKEMQLERIQAARLVAESTVDPTGHKRYEREENVYHMINGSHLYTVSKQNDKHTKQPIALVITMFERKLRAPSHD